MATTTMDDVRRFTIERDMSNGLYDVWDAVRSEYVVINVSRAAAERALRRARERAASGWHTWRKVS